MGDDAAEAAQIGKHYDERSPIGDEFRDGQLHMWYWYDREDRVSLANAVARITRKVTDTLGLRPEESVLDAGCGPGTTAISMAERFGARVTGITVSRFEVERAIARAGASTVGDLVDFEYGDFMDLEYPDGSFDAVLALESLQNAPDLTQVLAELYRVLRPGGRISMSDFSLEQAGPPERLARFMETLRLSRLPSLTEWIGHLRAAGFDVEEYTQCGPRVLGRKAKYIEAALVRRQEIADKFGEAALNEFAEQHHGFFAPRRNQVGYVILSARKPYR
ncbi:methyltransferase domain-containing protein [Actinophytocola oryzae]|uniref:Avermectin B 5-O-methyltransferase n=1 Tax=Actinophytocola oryzae TaxID=502181 RepID=A0A4R7UY43_9PSEU|nr:methyltransferase domain-containing protein [Actinophytocola oryzae]TDV41047.1 avermectin B 5-O-methyltransferase [Actinophytocola oryzae]